LAVFRSEGQLNTTDVVTRICQTNPDLTRPDALSFVKEAVLLLTKGERESALYVDTSTGDFPYLTTTAGTYLYSINTTTIPIWKVAHVLMDNPATGNVPDGNTMWISSQSSVDTSALRSVNVLGRLYYEVPFKGTTELGSTAPKVLFYDDPTSTTATYRIAGYQEESAIVSESVDIAIPDQLFSTCVIPACLALIDGTFNGRYIDQVAYITTVLAPKVRWAINKDDSNLTSYQATPMGY
jgi:hypothetical protein